VRDDNFNFQLLKSEFEFLKILLIEFIKKNEYHIADAGNQIFLHDGGYNNVMQLEDCLITYVLQAQSIVYHMRQEQYHNITIDEFLSWSNQEQVSTFSKKI